MDSVPSSASGASVFDLSSRRHTEVTKTGAKYVLHSNLKLFSKAIAALARLGSDLYLEPVDSGLFLRSNDKIKSACGSFLFSNDFFSDVDKTRMEPTGDRLAVCRLPMKSALSLFKGLQFNEKNYVSSELWVNPFTDHFVFEVAFAYGATRSLKMNLLEASTPFKTTADRSKCMNVSVVFAERLLNFLDMLKRDSQDIIISATAEQFQFKNYIPTDEYSRSMVKTTANVPMTIFARHEIRRPTEISFSHKDFLAVLSFAAQHSASVSLYYDIPGKPLIVAIEDDVNYVCEFVMVTIENEEGQEEQPLVEPAGRVIEPKEEQQSQPHSNHPSQHRRETSQPVQSQQREDILSARHELPSQHIPQPSSVRKDEPPVKLLHIDGDILPTSSRSIGFGHPRMSSSPIRMRQETDFVQDEEMLSPVEREAPAVFNDLLVHHNDVVVLNDEVMEVQPMEDPNPINDVYDLPATPPPLSSRSIVTVSDDSVREVPASTMPITQPTQELEDQIEKQKFRKFFLSSNTATQNSNNLYANKTILANDSDVED